MPDPKRETISATQMPALFGASPYLTRWMLLRHFIHGDSIDTPEHNRMDWGKRMQPLLLAQAAEDLHLEVYPNHGDEYVRHGLLGCTRDAIVICPDRGPGTLECKCVFDYKVWAESWGNGERPPRHVEIQTQQQMAVGDGDTPFKWGVIAVWLAGQMIYFERKPIDELWAAMGAEAAKFFADVEAKREGEPFGEAVESPLIARVFKLVEGKQLDLREHPDAMRLAEDAAMWKWHSGERLVHEKGEKALKAKLAAMMGDAAEVLFAGGIIVRAKMVNRSAFSVPASSYRQFTIYVPAARVAAAGDQANTLAGG